MSRGSWEKQNLGWEELTLMGVSCSKQTVAGSLYLLSQQWAKSFIKIQLPIFSNFYLEVLSLSSLGFCFFAYYLCHHVSMSITFLLQPTFPWVHSLVKQIWISFKTSFHYLNIVTYKKSGLNLVTAFPLPGQDKIPQETPFKYYELRSQSSRTIENTTACLND